MPEDSSPEPIALGDSLGQLLGHIKANETIGPTLVGQLRNSLRRRWRLMDEAVVAVEIHGRFSSEATDLLDQLDVSEAEVEALVAQLNAVGIDGKAKRVAINQEREPTDPAELVAAARELAAVG